MCNISAHHRTVADGVCAMRNVMFIGPNNILLQILNDCFYLCILKIMEVKPFAFRMSTISYVHYLPHIDVMPDL